MGHSGTKHRFGYCSALLRLLTEWVIAIEVIDERNLVDVVGYHRDLKAGRGSRGRNIRDLQGTTPT